MPKTTKNASKVMFSESETHRNAAFPSVFGGDPVRPSVHVLGRHVLLRNGLGIRLIASSRVEMS